MDQGLKWEDALKLKEFPNFPNFPNFIISAIRFSPPPARTTPSLNPDSLIKAEYDYPAGYKLQAAFLSLSSLISGP